MLYCLRRTALLGAIAVMFDYDRMEAERQFRLAMAHDPVPRYLTITDSFISSIKVGLKKPPPTSNVHYAKTR